METILVTGGAGFIGSHVCDRLLNLRKRVICVDNLTPYYSPKTKIANIQQNLSNPNFEFFPMDIRNKEDVEQIFKQEKISKIIHLAARAGVRPSIEKPVWYKETNIDGTINMFELARKYNIKKVVFASSSSVYGNSKEIPFNENNPCNHPISPYAATKKATEVLAHTYHKNYGLNLVGLRFFSVYGPRGRPDMAPMKFTLAMDKNKPIEMFGDGKTSRDWTYVQDIVDGVIAAAEKDIQFAIINLGNSTPVKLKDFISTIEKYLGKKATIIKKGKQEGDVDHTYADIKKAKQLLGYNPKTPLDQGIKQMIEWYQEQKLKQN